MGRQKQNNDVPTFEELIIPTVKAIKELGGSGSIEEINIKVYEIAKIPNKILEIPHGSDTRSEVDYRLAWSRTYLKKSGILENSVKGIWALKSDININELDVDEIKKIVRTQSKKEGNNKTKNKVNLNEDDVSNFISYLFNKPKKERGTISRFNNKEIDYEVQQSEGWKDKLLNVLYKISPEAFERLTQRILRESGFVQVTVTGKSGDGGIDGKGIVRMSGLLSFHVIFQCKRYKGSVTPSQIRDFRGAMQGRADKGLFITTGSFTKEAIREATRDGAPPIDLIDGELLCDKLKELKLGVQTQLMEKMEIDNEWFDNI
jgi:restriction system protein